MTDVDVMIIGLDALARQVARLPERVRDDLQAVAAATAARVRDRARAILRSKTHGTGATANAIGIAEDRRNKQYLVISQAPSGEPSNLPFWLEYGTMRNGVEFMGAKSYMRPAREAETERYRRDMAIAAQAVVNALVS